MTKVCVFGVGAIGGLIAARLATTGVELTGICRGAQLDAIRRQGLCLKSKRRPYTVQINVTDDVAELEPQDIVFVTLKAHQLSGVVDQLGSLLEPESIVVNASNGFPWWYFSGIDNSGLVHLDSVDPGGRIWNVVGPQRAIGCVIYPAAHVESPGVIDHVFGERFSLGQPDNHPSGRLRALADLMGAAGFDAPVSEDIRTELWIKLMANVAYNPMSLLTGQTLGEMLDDPKSAADIEQLMDEARSVAAAMGVDTSMQSTTLMTATRPLGEHKTSMLRDFESGRALELDAIIQPVIELARRYGVATPMLDQIARSTEKFQR